MHNLGLRLALLAHIISGSIAVISTRRVTSVLLAKLQHTPAIICMSSTIGSPEVLVKKTSKYLTARWNVFLLDSYSYVI